MQKQISLITTAAIMLTAFVTVALYNGSETAQAAGGNMTTNATAAAGGNMTTNATAAAGGNMTQPLVPPKAPK